MKKARSTIFLVLTAMIWGFAFVAQRVGADYLRPFTFNGIRFVMGALSLIPVILLFERGKSDKKTLSATVKYGILAGVVLCAASNLQQYGVELTGSAGKSGFITGLYTVLVPVIYFLFFRRKTGLPVWIGAVVTVGGLYLLCGVDGSVPFGWGDVVLIVGAVLWALHIIVLDHVGDKVRPLRFSAMQFSVCAVITLICAVIFDRGDFAVEYVRQAMIPLLYGGIGSVGIAYTCQLLGQRDADPTFAAIVLSTEAVFSAIGAAIILKEYMEPAGYVGCALIFAGIVLSQIPVGKKK
ncbi:MAG: DMT family transporter [Clostridia bacterium]|nr:DMT family transporter [Clostridia bacterium]